MSKEEIIILMAERARLREIWRPGRWAAVAAMRAIVDPEIRKVSPRARIPDVEDMQGQPNTGKYDKYASQKLGKGRYFSLARPVGARYDLFEDARRAAIKRCDARISALALVTDVIKGEEWREVTTVWNNQFSSQTDADSYARVAAECRGGLAADAKGVAWQVTGVRGNSYTCYARVVDEVDLEILRRFPVPVEDVVAYVKSKSLNTMVFPGVRS